ncbi:RPLP2 [Cordylochernes scorpioides]|uniref:Large ribosomal subunit protein P2 n=1 Tax=Cordylochernes scorpioides TaxID=51811 RepID=A0ABY6KTZ5_9ARAC|nr:RPLP2 [Cordylochernes scorpioides]
MRYLAAYSLLALGGKSSPSEKEIKQLLGAADCEYDEDKAEKALSALSGKNLEEPIEKGKKQLSTVPSGGVVAASSGAPAAAAGGDSKAEAKKEEKKEESDEESDEDMGFGLFD